MTKRFKIVGLAVLILACLGAIYWWFWSLGSLQNQTPPKLQLIIEKGTASVIRAGTQAKEAANNGMELKLGDKIVTDQGSMVSVSAFDRAVSRLDENTTLTVTEASLQGTTFVARWKLDAGRAWSRVLRLMDLESAYEGQANQVVATVRGTSFALISSQDKNSILVEHGSVRGAKIDSSSLKSKPEFVVGGQWIDFAKNGDVLGRGESVTSSLSDDIRSRINIEENPNLELDQNFSEKAAADLLASLGSTKSVKPDNWLYSLSLWSEAWHLRLAGKKTPELKALYLGRRLGNIHDLIGRGKSGLAYQMLSQLKKDVEILLNSERGSDYRIALKPIMSRALLAVSDVDPSSNVFRYKLELEDLYARLWDDSPAQTFYARSLSVDARLDEAERFNCDSKETGQVKEAINAVEQGMARQKNDFDKIKSNASNLQRTILEEKMLVQTQRLDFLNRRLTACPTQGQDSSLPEANATSTQGATTTQSDLPGIATSSASAVLTSQPKTTATTSRTTTNPPTNPPVINPPTQANLGLTRIELFAQPSPANVGDRVNLFVKGYKSDGSTIDVTGKAVFQVIGGLGSISGSTYLASQAGSVTVKATVTDNGNPFSAQVSLMINASVVLSRLSVQPTNQNLRPGQSLPLSVTAYYTNGFSKDVTSAVTWFLSNSLASMAGSSIVAGPTSGGVTVTAQYSDAGSKISGDAFFTIVASAATSLQ